jgi:hypothetical protein
MDFERNTNNRVKRQCDVRDGRMSNQCREHFQRSFHNQAQSQYLFYSKSYAPNADHDQYDITSEGPIQQSFTSIIDMELKDGIDDLVHKRTWRETPQ